MVQIVTLTKKFEWKFLRSPVLTVRRTSGTGNKMNEPDVLLSGRAV